MITVLVGTRPELIKMAPVLRKLVEKKIQHIFIHSNQHYSFEMDQQIINDLKLKKPDFHLKVGSGSHAVQTGKIMEGVEKICQDLKPEILLVHGDTNTTLAGALAAKKLQIKVGHIEAGLRSFDYKMPEEINRILVDRISDILFAPTITAKQNLLKEGVSEDKIFVTGNTVVDALYDHIKLANKSKILKKLKIRQNEYIILTAHRGENVDAANNLKKLIKLIDYASKKLNSAVVWPIHPRTKHNLQKLNLIKKGKNVIIIEPVGYIDMLALLSNAKLILTDSGGLQEEAYILKKPLMTLRDSTERPETLSANFLIHLDTKKFDRAIKKYDENKVRWNDDLGNGHSSDIIVDKLVSFLNHE